MSIADRLAKAAGDAVRSFREGSGADADVGEQEMEALLRRAGLAEATEEKPRALFHDPYAVMDWGGWREKPTPLTYETLKHMSYKCTPITAIVQVRINQISQHCKPQQGRYDKGFKVILRDRRDLSRAMSKAEQMQAALIERMLETTGFLLPGEKPSDRDSFRTFIKKGLRDSLVLDQFCFEKIRDRKGRISRFVALPGDTIRPAVADIEHMDPAERHNRVSHVQVYEDTVIAEFGPDDLAWLPMNPRSDLRANTFGFSPVEQLMNLVTAWLFGFEHNQRFFSQGSAIKGILNIKGAVPDRQLKAFRRMWYSMVSGVQNAWRTPILNSEDIQWVSMHSNNREMEFSAWMDWLTKMVCAVFGMDPMEINFIFGNTGQKSSLNNARPGEDEMIESKDKGLLPLMEHIEDAVNTHIVWDLNPDFEFQFTGINAKEEQAQRKAWMEETSAFKTVDEVRAEMDLPPLPDKTGEIVRDPTWLQNKSQADQAKQASQQGGAGGPGGPENPEGDGGEGGEGDEEDGLEGPPGLSEGGDDTGPLPGLGQTKGAPPGGAGERQPGKAGGRPESGGRLPFARSLSPLVKSRKRTRDGDRDIHEIEFEEG